MTDTELLSVDPMTLDGDMLTKWEHAQKKAMRVNKVYESQLKYRVEQEELEARSYKTKRDIKVNNLENMKATIEMENIYGDYEASVKSASIRMKEKEEALTPTLEGIE